MGYKNLNKALVPRIISMVEESNAKLRRPHTRIVRPHQWHIAKGGPTVERKFRRVIGFDMTKGVVATPTFNASHQTPWLHLCGEDPWTVLHWPPQLTGGLGRCLMRQALKWCTGQSINGGLRSPEGSYIMWLTLQRLGETKICSKNW